MNTWQLKMTYMCLLALPLKSANSQVTDIIGKSFDLRKTEIRGDHTGGRMLFEKVESTANCYKEQRSLLYKSQSSYYRNNEEFYKTLATDSGIDVRLMGVYTMGYSLNIKTKSLSGGQVNVTGASVEEFNRSSISFFDQNCYKGEKAELKKEVVESFDALPIKIKDPEKELSWRRYGSFLLDFGTHIVTHVDIGTAMKQWTFSETSRHYNKNQLIVKACAYLRRRVQIKVCNTYTEEEYKEISNIDSTSYFEARGSTESQAAIGYKYLAIWDLFMIKYKNSNPRRYAKAHILKQFYEGYLDFGCQEINEGGMKLRRFQHRNHSTTEDPDFECVLEREGCHSDDDCHADKEAGKINKSFCYGDTCVEHTFPSFVDKAEGAKIRKSRSGSSDEGINTSCYAKKGVYSRGCTMDWSKDKVIWQDERSDQLISAATRRNKSRNTFIVVTFFILITLKAYFI